MNAFEQSLLERLGEKAFQKIQSPRIGIAGAGGLGSNCALFLARSGFKHFVLVDFDRLDASNLNRQFYFLPQLGQPKPDALKANLLAINPDLDIQTRTLRLGPQNLKSVFEDCTVVVEALDAVAGKKMMSETYWHSDKLLVSASGLAGWGDAGSLRVRQLAAHYYLVGDLTSEVTPQIPPMAPRVNLAAALQADIVLAWVLEGTYARPGSLAKKAASLAVSLYGLTAEAHSRGRSNPEVVRQMLQGGIRLIQYREKEKSQKEKLKECRRLRDMTRQAGATFIVNDDAALALAVDADGVHLGQDDLPVPEARALLGFDKIIGLSTHAPEQLQAALAQGADYIGVGPIYPTQTKTDVCPAVGLEYLDYARAHSSIPFVAIGGIKEHNLAEVVRHGAACAALVTEITGAENIPEKITRLKAILQNPDSRLNRFT